MGLWPAVALTERSDEVKEYFTTLGYYVTWDFKTCSGEQWWEILDGNTLVAQIDMGIPLADIREDICQFHLGKDGTSKSNYKVNGYGSKFDELLKKVYENCNYRPSN